MSPLCCNCQHALNSVEHFGKPAPCTVSLPQRHNGSDHPPPVPAPVDMQEGKARSWCAGCATHTTLATSMLSHSLHVSSPLIAASSWLLSTRRCSVCNASSLRLLTRLTTSHHSSLKLSLALSHPSLRSCILFANQAVHRPGCPQALRRAESPVLAASPAAQRAQAPLMPATQLRAPAAIRGGGGLRRSSAVPHQSGVDRHRTGGLAATTDCMRSGQAQWTGPLEASAFERASRGALRVAAEAGLPGQQQRARLQPPCGCLLLGGRHRRCLRAHGRLRPVRQPAGLRRWRGGTQRTDMRHQEWCAAGVHASHVHPGRVVPDLL